MKFQKGECKTLQFGEGRTTSMRTQWGSPDLQPLYRNVVGVLVDSKLNGNPCSNLAANKSNPTFKRLKKTSPNRGTSVAQSVKCLALDLGSGSSS